MVSVFRCGHCGVLTARTSVHGLGNAPWPFGDPGGATTWDVLRCAACLRFSLSAVCQSPSGTALFPPETWPRIDTVFVPPHITADYEEAIRCMQAGAFKAAAAMARRAAQSTCLHLGATPRTHLFDQIDELNEKGELTNRLAQVAHRVRVFGNVGAHPGEDGLDEVTKEEATEALQFLEHLIQHVFILGEEEEA